MIWLYLLVVVLSLALAFGARTSAPPSRAELFAAAASVVASMVATAYLLIAPGYAALQRVSAADASTSAPPSVSPASSSVVQTEGWAAVLPMLAFVAVSALPFLFWRRTGRVYAELTSAAALASLSLLTGFSIGPVYLPSAVLMLLAGVFGRTGRSDRGRS